MKEDNHFIKLSEEEISRSVYNETVYKKGKEYYEQDKVKEIEIIEYTKDCIAIKGNVEGNYGIQYHPSFFIEVSPIKVPFQKTRETFISRKWCDCASIRKYGGACRHITALAYKFLEGQDAWREEMESRTSDGAMEMIRNYQNMNMKKIMEEKVEGHIILEPTLEVTHSLKVTFRLGEAKLYVLKNIMEFVLAVEEGKTVSYGKNLEFNHNIGSFKEEYRPLVEFILMQAEDILEKYEYFDYYTAKKDITLSKYSLQQFLKLCMGKEICIKGENGNKRKVLVIEENPYLKLIIEKKGEKAYRLHMEPIEVLFGVSKLYIWKGDYLYCCDKNYSKAMESFLKEFAFSSEEALSVHEKHMQLLCSQVLGQVESYIEIEEREVELEQFLPPKAEVTFYLDAPDINKITCKVEALYGDTVLNPLEEWKDTDTYRDMAKEFQIKETIFRYLTKWDEKEKIALCENNEEMVYEFLTQAVPLLHEFGAVMATDRIKMLNVKHSPKVSVGVSIQSDLLKLEIKTDDYDLEEIKAMLDSYHKKQKYYRLKNGEFITLEENSFELLSEVVDSMGIKEKDFIKGKVQVPLHRALYLDKLLKEKEQIAYQRDHYFKELVRNIKSVEDSDYEVPSSLQSILRSYQKTGYRWLRTLACYGFGGILADDMGLGKTIQVISFLLAKKAEQQADGKTLGFIVCPTSLVYNWESELERFSPQLSKVVVTGSAEERIKLIQNEENVDILITSFELLRRDIALYEEKTFYCHIVDEAQFIKNHNTQISKATKQIKSSVRFALTGTPIENRLSELWSIFDFLMPGYLYHYARFKRELEIPIVQNGEKKAIERFQRMIKPFVLRRIKKDVLKELPEKVEQVVYTKLEGEQEKLYIASVQMMLDNLQRKTEKEYKENKLQILSELTKLRQICCAPSLYFKDYQGESAKLDIAEELILNAVEGKHKVLVFSQFTTLLSLLEERLQKNQCSYYLLTGSTGKEKRMAMVNAFQKDEVPVFLISLKAGGTGLNLTAADIVLHLDPWWNIAAQNQATDRAYRIGQKNSVSIFHLIAKDTIEEKILKMQSMKKDLTEQVLWNGDGTISALTKEEILSILE